MQEAGDGLFTPSGKQGMCIIISVTTRLFGAVKASFRRRITAPIPKALDLAYSLRPMSRGSSAPAGGAKT